MLAARSFGITLREFDGWTPKTVTRVTAWRDGQPEVWETTSESPWDRRERSLMLALAHFEAGCCRRCGEHLAKSMDPMTDPDRPDAPHHWVAEGPDECFACKALVRAERKLADDKDGGSDLLPYSIHTPALIPHTPRVRRTRGR